MKETIRIIEECKGAKRIGISGHIRPDGDCVGSCLGMYNYLLAAGYVGLDDEEIRNVRNRSMDRVRRTHGFITFEDAVEEERAFGTDE